MAASQEEPPTEQSADFRWTKAEQWAWGKIRAGDIADFSAEHGELDPRKRKGWVAARKLGAGFLRAILFEKACAAVRPLEGVRIRGAKWAEPLELVHGSIGCPLWLEDCRFERPVRFTGLDVAGRLSLKGSAFRGGRDQPSLDVSAAMAHHANLAHADFKSRIAGADAIITGSLDLSSAMIGGELDLGAAKVGRLFLRGASCRAVKLSNAEIDQDVDLRGAILKGALDMEDIRIRQDLAMSGSDAAPTLFKGDVVLIGAIIEGHINLSGATVTGPVRMNGLEVKKHLFMGSPEEKGRTHFGSDVDLGFAVIRGHLDLTGTTVGGNLDMSGIQIEENLAGWSTEASPTTFRGQVDMSGGRIKGDADFRQARFEKKVILPNLRAGNLDLGGAQFAKSVDMIAARIERNLALNRVALSEGINLSDIYVGRTVFITNFKGDSPTLTGEMPRFKDIRMTNAVIMGQLECLAICEGAVSLVGTHVRHQLFIRAKGGESPVFKQGLDLSFANIEGVADLNGATVEATLKLTGLQVGRDLGLRANLGGPLLIGGGNIKGSLFVRVAEDGKVDMRGLQVGHDLTVSATPVARAKPLTTGAAGGSGPERPDARGGQPPDDDAIDMRDVHVGQDLTLLGTFAKPVRLSQARIDRVFNAAEANFGASLDLSFANIDGVADLTGATVASALNLTSVRVGQDLRLTASLRGPVLMANGDVEGSLFVTIAANGEIDMRGLQVGHNLTVDGTLAPEPDPQVQPAVDADDSIDMRDIHVGQDLTLVGTFAKPVRLSQARIDRVLNSAGANFGRTLDLSSSTINGQLCLRVPPRRALPLDKDEAPVASLDLRDAKAASLQLQLEAAHLKSRDTWPMKGSVQLDGFTYDRLGGSAVAQSDETIEHKALWYKHWLDLDQPYSPQPYEHLAAILRHAGQTERANWILYCGRKRARAGAWQSPPKPHAKPADLDPISKMGLAVRYRARQATWFIKALTRWLGLSLLQWTIGYGLGYRYFRALLWAVVLTGIGLWMLGSEPVGEPSTYVLASWQQKAAYSFDQLLPIVELNDSFADVKLPARAEYYFYFHKLLGFLLGSFIAAGIAGLTQRSKS